MWNGELANGGGTGLVGGEVGFRWKESHRQERSGQDSIGRAAADREAGADYAGHAETLQKPARLGSPNKRKKIGMLCTERGSNPRVRIHRCLKPTP